jgi:hypothetical protein
MLSKKFISKLIYGPVRSMIAYAVDQYSLEIHVHAAGALDDGESDRCSD